MIGLPTAAAVRTRVPVRLLGGEWAGWCCAFNATTGTVQRVPERFCSDATIQWGQVPSGFEECATETWAGQGSLARRTVRLLPEEGCNIEDLSAIITRVELTTAAGDAMAAAGDAMAAAAAACAIDTVIQPSRASAWCCETIFSGLGGGAPPRSRHNALEALAVRTRVSCIFDAATGALVSGEPVLVWQERLWSDGPSLMVREGGGRCGIDAAWLSSAVGIDCFGKQTEAQSTLPAPRAHAEGATGFALVVAGGVELCGSPGKLEVALASAAGTTCVRRSDFDSDAGVCHTEVLA